MTSTRSDITLAIAIHALNETLKAYYLQQLCEVIAYETRIRPLQPTPGKFLTQAIPSLLPGFEGNLYILLKPQKAVSR